MMAGRRFLFITLKTNIYMTDDKILIYEAPQMEIMEVQVEQGFATSGGTEGFGEENGTW